MADRTFQITRNGVALGASGAYAQSFLVPVSSAEYSESNSAYGFEMILVVWGADGSDNGFYKYVFGATRISGTTQTPFVETGGAATGVKVYSMAGGTGILGSVDASLSSDDILVTLNWDAPNGVGDRYWRAWINAYTSDNVDA